LPTAWFDEAKTTLLDAGVDGGLEDRLGAVDIVCQDAVPRRFGARIARQVNHDIDSVHRLADGVLVGDIRNDELARLVVRRGSRSSNRHSWSSARPPRMASPTRPAAPVSRTDCAIRSV